MIETETNLLPHGLAIDYAIHDKKTPGKPHNPHCHILVTLRGWENGGWGPKLRHLNHHGLMRDLRESWAISVNYALRDAGIDAAIDHRSHEERGLASRPTQKEGAGARGRAQRGKKSERVERNVRIRAYNASLRKPPMNCKTTSSAIVQKTTLVEKFQTGEATGGLSVGVLSDFRTKGRGR